MPARMMMCGLNRGVRITLWRITMSEQLVREKLFSELNMAIVRLKRRSRLNLLERFYELMTKDGWTHDEAVEYDALKIVLEYK